MVYLDFIENNDWEGEKWHFYIPVAGNEDVMDRFKEIVNAVNDEDGMYELGREYLKEEEVDTLIRFGDTGYMPYHNKLEGKLDVKKLIKDLDSDDDPFYKGGIKDYLHG